jgi:hypothetical protein
MLGHPARIRLNVGRSPLVGKDRVEPEFRVPLISKHMAVFRDLCRARPFAQIIVRRSARSLLRRIRGAMVSNV